MRIIRLFRFLLVLEWSLGQVIDIGGVWESTCPHGCSCQIARFSDLPLHQWMSSNKNTVIAQQDENYNGFLDSDHPMNDEFLKVATCVITGNPAQLFASLPSDLQVLTILEAGDGNSEIVLQSVDLQRFAELISLDIKGIDDKDAVKNHRNAGSETKRKGGIVLTAETLLPIGHSLLYLNLERVTFTSLSLASKNQVSLVVKPMNSPTKESSENDSSSSHHNGHRLIFLSQQNSGEKIEKEILPYDVYKQEVEGEREALGIFTGLTRLTHLRAYDCALKDISWHMFDGLDNLFYLSLEKNNLRFIPEFCFYGTPNLKTLSLASNQLLTLKSIDLAGLLALEQLDLQGNNLTFLSELSLPPFPALTVADFRGNPLDIIFPSTFEIMNATRELYLGGNGATLKLQKHSLLGLRLVETLHLYNLEIPLLERFILQGMPILTHLKMNGNIIRIDFDAFLDVKKLEVLDLSHCQIRDISMDAFYGLEDVKRIDLSYNNLERIPAGLFTLQQHKELKEIILYKNKLTVLPWDFFRHLRGPHKHSTVENVRLDGNPWDCSCAMLHWNPHLVNRERETAPRCLTPRKLQNWGVFHALRKGGLHCKHPRRRHIHRSLKVAPTEDNSVMS